MTEQDVQTGINYIDRLKRLEELRGGGGGGRRASESVCAFVRESQYTHKQGTWWCQDNSMIKQLQTSTYLI